MGLEKWDQCPHCGWKFPFVSMSEKRRIEMTHAHRCKGYNPKTAEPCSQPDFTNHKPQG